MFRILVVEDDAPVRNLITTTLKTHDYKSIIAENGEEAIRQASSCNPDVILLDLGLPDMDGVETTRQIRSIAGDDSAIIILTAYNWDDVLEEALHAGVDSFVAKPLFASTVIEEFQKALKQRTAMSEERKRADLTGRRVLLAEDVEINAEIMMELMKTREVTVDNAPNGKIAVEMFEAHEPGYYDAVLMDMRMPEMDGLEATMAIRALNREDAKDVPIIALTANAFDEDVQKSLQAGLNAHLSKPVEPDVLFETLEGLIRP